MAPPRVKSHPLTPWPLPSNYANQLNDPISPPSKPSNKTSREKNTLSSTEHLDEKSRINVSGIEGIEIIYVVELGDEKSAELNRRRLGLTYEQRNQLYHDFVETGAGEKCRGWIIESQVADLEEEPYEIAKDPFIASAAETREYLALPKRKKRRDEGSSAVSRLFFTPAASGTMGKMDTSGEVGSKDSEDLVMAMEVDE